MVDSNNMGLLGANIAGVIPKKPTPSSVQDASTQSGGQVISIDITPAGSAGSEAIDLFEVIGAVNILAIWAIVDGVSGPFNMTAASFILEDGGATVDITESVTGLDVSNSKAGTIVGKLAPVDTALVLSSSNDGSVSEPPVSTENGVLGVFYPCLVVAKEAATTKIQYQYTTSDAPITGVTMKVFCRFAPLTSTSTLQ